MKTVRIVVGVICAATLAMVPQPASTRADTWRPGDVFVGVGSDSSNPGRIDVYDSNGVPRNQSIQIPGGDAGYTTGCYYNPESQTLWATTFLAGTIHEFDGTQSIRRITLPSTIAAVESIAFTPDGRGFFAGTPYTASSQLARFTYTPGAAGNPASAVVSAPQLITLPIPAGRTKSRLDWMDVTSENGQTVIYFTDESAGNDPTGAKIYKYFPDSGAPPTVFATIPQGTVYALRILPAESGLLVAGPAFISRLNLQGQEVTRYNGLGNDGAGYFALNIAPDGRNFWTATADFAEDATGNAVPTPRSGRLLKYNISASQYPIVSVATGAPAVSGLCVKLEYTAARNVCSDPATGQPITCPRLEVCNSGADDDGDGLPDLSDPDCILPGTAEICGDGEQGDENRNGLINDGCSRTTVERTADDVSFAPRVPVPGDSITYSAAGLPPGLTMSPQGRVTGTVDDGASGVYQVTLTADRTAVADSTATFVWTITDVNRAPVASAVAAQQNATEGVPFLLDINAFDPDTSTDGDVLTYSSTTLPAGLSIDAATGLISGSPAFDTQGSNQITVTITDDHAQRSTTERPLQQQNLQTTVSFELTVQNVNGPPRVVAVPAPGPYLVAAGLPVLAVTGTDPDGDTFEVITVSSSTSSLVIGSDGVIRLAANATLVEGTHTFTVRVRDVNGNVSADVTFSLTFVSDQAPVCSAAAPSISLLWPPNHKMEPVSVLGVTDPDGDAITIRIDGIHQDEPTNTVGDGNTSVDGAVSSDRTTAFVRAERSGTPQVPGDGRVYRILFTATAKSLSCSGVINVGVPHDQRGTPPVASLTWYNSLTGARIQ